MFGRWNKFFKKLNKHIDENKDWNKVLVNCRHRRCAWNKDGLCTNKAILLEDADSENLKCISFDFE